MKGDNKLTYTQWWIKYPWHVSGTPESGKVPPDCQCEYCIKRRKTGGKVVR